MPTKGLRDIDERERALKHQCRISLNASAIYIAKGSLPIPFLYLRILYVTVNSCCLLVQS